MASILPSGGPIGALKTNNILNWNNFLSKKPILDLNTSLDGDHQHLKLWLSHPLRVTHRILYFWVTLEGNS